VLSSYTLTEVITKISLIQASTKISYYLKLKIKICGITSLDDAKMCLDAGADYLGFNFYEKSKRQVSVEDATAIVRSLPASVQTVGIFVNHSREQVDSIARRVALSTLQFHGDEDLDFVDSFRSHEVIKAIRLGKKTKLEEVKAFSKVSDRLLFDAYVPGEEGGTGERITDSLLEQVSSYLGSSFLAGGLNPENIKDKVERWSPWGIDLASGVESAPGKKSPGSIQKLFLELGGVD